MKTGLLSHASLFTFMTLILAVHTPQTSHGADFDEAVAYLAESVIEGKALNRAQGAIAVNQAAGDGNLQANSLAVAIGAHASAGISSRQDIAATLANMPDRARVEVGEQAFGNASGVIAVNQVSGVANIQANDVALVRSAAFSGLSDDEMALTHANILSSSPDASGQRTTSRAVSVEDTAFEGARGLIQVNQVAGRGNIASNRMLMLIKPES